MGLPALAEDYLFVGPLLVARLLDQVPDIPAELVETADQVFAADKRQRALMVMWANEVVGPLVAGRSQVSKQRWLVILGLKNVGREKDARQSMAGPLMYQVHSALTGWVPKGAVNRLQRVSSPMRPDIRADKALYPMGFEIELSL